MAKKSDLKFKDWEAFAQANPHFTIEKPVPAHIKIEPNYAAIRAVLRSGKAIDGVELVDILPTEKPSPEQLESEKHAHAEEHKRKLSDILAKSHKD